MNVTATLVWERLAEELQKISIIHYCENYNEVKLYIAAILSGAREKDKKYFNGPIYLEHCKYAALNPDFVRRMIDKVNYYIDNGMPLASRVSPLEENGDDTYRS